MENAIIDFMEQVNNQSIKEESDESDQEEDEENYFDEVAHKMDKESLKMFFKENHEVAKMFDIDHT
tara:strand:- start:261 stop:458 length:198 start_codon:yes stop_codon:yes gene_type:complete